MLEAPTPYRTDDIHTHPRFRGWWPRGHPDMRSFLGVPIVAPEGVIGAFYLTDKEGADAFADADQELIELLAAHAAIAITNARLYERSRELSMLAERNRLALELHDVGQPEALRRSCSTAEAAATLLDRDAERGARPGRARCSALAARGAGGAALADRSSCARPTSSATGCAARCASTSSVLRAPARRDDRRSTSTTASSAGARPRPRGPARSPRRRCTTRVRHADARARARVRLRADGRRGSCSRSPTTAPASTPATPSCARATWA